MDKEEYRGRVLMASEILRTTINELKQSCEQGIDDIQLGKFLVLENIAERLFQISTNIPFED